jgi:hypothetical protein
MVFDDPRCQDVFALGDASPDGLGGELALAVAELGLERSFGREKLADDVLPGGGVEASVAERVPAVLVVDQVRGGAELPGERVHREVEFGGSGVRGPVGGCGEGVPG